MSPPDASARALRHTLIAGGGSAGWMSAAAIAGNIVSVFQNPSWLAVYIGQHVDPERYAPMVDLRREVDVGKFLASIRPTLAQAAGATPTHRAFIDKNCKAPPP